MNARLERVRTASKVAVQLVWQVAADLPPGTKAARDLLLKDPVRLTEADRESLHRFFRERIEQARSDNTQLITGSDGDDAVTTARFTWDGTDLLPDDQQFG